MRIKKNRGGGVLCDQKKKNKGGVQLKKCLL